MTVVSAPSAPASRARTGGWRWRMRTASGVSGAGAAPLVHDTSRATSPRARSPAASLAYGEAVHAGVPPELAPRLVHDEARTQRLRRRVPLDERGHVPAGHEADLHALGLVGDRQPERGRLGAHLRLGEIADREERVREVGGAEREQEVGLVLGRVDGGPEVRAAGRRVGADARVVAGCEPAGAERAGALPEDAELEVPVAARARVRGAAGHVLGDERTDDVPLEVVGEVEDVVREAEAVGDRARVVEVVERAAAPAAARREAKRDADHLVARGS